MTEQSGFRTIGRVKYRCKPREDQHCLGDLSQHRTNDRANG